MPSVFAGIIPECSLLCYLGSLATDITQVISGEAGPRGALTYVLAGITLLIIIGSATWATLFVRYAICFLLQRKKSLKTVYISFHK